MRCSWDGCIVLAQPPPAFIYGIIQVIYVSTVAGSAITLLIEVMSQKSAHPPSTAATYSKVCAIMLIFNQVAEIFFHLPYTGEVPHLIANALVIVFASIILHREHSSLSNHTLIALALIVSVLYVELMQTANIMWTFHLSGRPEARTVGFWIGPLLIMQGSVLLCIFNTTNYSLQAHTATALH